MDTERRGKCNNQNVLWEPGRLQNCMGARWRVPKYSLNLVC